MTTKNSKPKKVSEARSVYKTTSRNRILVKCKKTLMQTYGERLKGVILYGSMARKQASPTSDIDLLVEIDSKDPIDRGEKLLELWDQFEIFFRRKVDLLTESSIHNPFLRKSIDSTKVLIYDGSGEKVLV